jgi:nicotinate-nucleotide adenylyltransferase
MDDLPGSARRIAFFGGSFDPPHLGHLAVARAARAALSLDVVLFAPVGSQPLKPRGATAPFADRLEMTRLAVAGEPGFEVSLSDAPSQSGAPNYTLETLAGLRSALPAGGALFCLMGADSFLGLRHWHRAAEVPFAANLVVASRPGESLDDLAAALPAGLSAEAAPECAPAGVLEGPPVDLLRFHLRNAAGDSAPLYVLPGLYVEISATGIREQMRSGSAPALVPDAVASYIRAHGLYR